MITNTDDFLAHYGILGMKWGIRRYQNKDGSYTSLGKKHRGEEVNYSDDYKRAHEKRDPRTMTNDELRRVNDRLNLERNYKQNTTPQQVQKQYTEGQLFVQQTMKSIGKAVVGATAVALASTMAKDAGSKPINFWNKNASAGEKWIIAAGVGAASMAALAYAYHQPKPKKSDNEED